MDAAEILTRIAAELALFAGVGFLLFGLNDLAVDIIYFVRRFWRSRTVYRRYRRAYASYYAFNKNPGFMAIFVPAWDESAVIASMSAFTSPEWSRCLCERTIPSNSRGLHGGTCPRARTKAPGPGSTWICVCPKRIHIPPDARIWRATTNRAPPVPRKSVEIIVFWVG